MSRRHAFFISDRTGLTSESMGEALLDQFQEVKFKRSTYPFVDTPDKARAMVKIIETAANQTAMRPLVFSSIINEEIRDIIRNSPGLHLSFFDAFLGILEKELGTKARNEVGRNHGIADTARYDARMEAVNFTLNHDDGVSDKDLKDADVILMGVSRSGKTPTCLYLALQYGIRAANYPLTPDDLDKPDLPPMVKQYRNKIYGLTIKPERLADIREERRPNSNYASISTCKQEVADAQAMFRRFDIPFTNTTHKSVEELAASIMRLATLAPQGRIQTELVEAEIGRLKWLWADETDADDAENPFANRLLDGLPAKIDAETLDLFDRVQLQHVIAECRRHPNMAAGRALFNVSRTEREKVNDSDRLRKYLQRFGLEWGDI